MDTSLLSYQNLTPKEGFLRIKALVNTIKKYHGVFVLLWHSSSFDELRLPRWTQVYEKTLECIRKQNIFNGLTRDVAKGVVGWWDNNVH